MRIRTIPPWVALLMLRSYILYPLTQCEAEPLAAAHVPKFEDLLTLWGATNVYNLELEDKTAKAQVHCDRAAVRLNTVADRISFEVLLLTGGEKDNATYTHFFGDKTVSVFKKMKLSTKLATMQGWLSYLAQSGMPTLVALVPDLTAAVKEAENAQQLKNAVELEKKHFRDFGERKQLVDKVNAVCKSVHGELGKLPHEVPGLPNDFADRFFRPDTGRHDDGEEQEEPTIESVTEQIESLTKELAESEALLEDLKAKKVEAEKAAAEIEKAKVALAQVQKTIADNEKLATELRAKIESA